MPISKQKFHAQLPAFIPDRGPFVNRRAGNGSLVNVRKNFLASDFMFCVIRMVSLFYLSNNSFFTFKNRSFPPTTSATI